MSETATEPVVLVDVNGPIKTITINRPQRKNALTHEVERLLLEAVRESDANDAIRVTILTGAGGNFSAGADISSPSDKVYDVTKHLKHDVHPTTTAIRASNKPFIAMVRGNCVGVGCNFALACDMIFAADDARFSEIFVRIGLATDGGGAYHLVRTLGYPRAYELIATGAMIPAPDAARLGLINAALPDAELDAHVMKTAEALASGPFISIQRCKANLREAMDGTLQSTLDMEAESQGFCFRSKDFMEGIMAFAQKRKPNFKGQ